MSQAFTFGARSQAVPALGTVMCVWWQSSNIAIALIVPCIRDAQSVKFVSAFIQHARAGEPAGTEAKVFNAICPGEHARDIV